MADLTGVAASKNHEPKDRAQALEWIDKAEALLTEAGDSHGTELSHMGFWAGLLIGHPLAPFWVQHVLWHPETGITVERASGWANRHHDGHDEDGMDPPDIIEAARPDPKYYWFVDIVRTVQNLYNVLVGWVARRVTLWDGPGEMVVHFGAGAETLKIDFMVAPKRQWARVVELTKVIEAGLIAMEWIHKNPPYDIKVRDAAQFQLDVENMIKEIRNGK